MVKKPLVVEALVFGMLLHLLLYHEPIREYSVAPGSIIKSPVHGGGNVTPMSRRNR
jgi:hypothetical protein